MPIATNKAQSAIIQLLTDELQENLDDVGLPDDCPSRSMSWDEAAWECTTKAEAWEELDNDERVKIYESASRIYGEAGEVWDAVMDCRNLFPEPKNKAYYTNLMKERTDELEAAYRTVRGLQKEVTELGERRNKVK